MDVTMDIRLDVFKMNNYILVELQQLRLYGGLVKIQTRIIF